MISHTGSTGWSSGVSPTTGASQLVMMPVGPRIRPRKAEPRASTIIGTVMVSGDSCGCWSSSQRFSPWKVMKNRRDM